MWDIKGQKERNAKQDAWQEERDFIQQCLVPGVVLSEKEEAWWAPLKAARDVKINEMKEKNQENYQIGFGCSNPTAKN